MTRVLFSGGPGCSGTGVLRGALGCHKDIATIPKELRFLLDPDGILPFSLVAETGWSPVTYDLALIRLERHLNRFTRRPPLLAFLNDLQRRFGADHIGRRHLLAQYVNFNLAAYCPEYAQLVRQLIDRLTSFRYTASWEGMAFCGDREMRFGPTGEIGEFLSTLGAFVSEFADRVATEQNRTAYLDGNDWNILWFDKLSVLIPGTKLVCIIRDPRDMIATHIRRRYAPIEIEQAASYVREIMVRWWRLRDRLPTGDFIEITLEDLVDCKEATLRRACEHYELDWDPAVLEFDVGGNNTGRWRREIPEENHERFLNAIGDLVPEMGYVW